ncbi:chitin-binding type-2 domain-containing protein [Caerostris extrusa]|uniref:Chitin-binding type-2 domain-containing protein n=1 Tax=Caerostris extrusa TaxID=172846 RepID=A0AAV4S8G7_CAEEX|nr:chitin-binding type-2 domain-containing protein [Caerostris extrusa]
MNILGVLCLTAAVLTVSARHKRGPGFYRDPNDCHQYIRCVDDFNSGRRLTMFVGRCRPGLVFDENVSSCNWPDLAAPCSNSPEHLRETASKLNNEKQNSQKTVQNNKISDQSNYRDKYESSQQQIVQKPNNPNHLSVQGQKGFQKPEDINLFQEAGTQEKIGQSFDDSEDLLAQERKPQISQGFEEVSKINDQQQTPITQQIREPVVQEKDEPLIQEQIVQQQSEQISPNPDVREPVVEEEPEQISQDEKFKNQLFKNKLSSISENQEPVVQEQTQQIKEKPHITEPVVQEQTQQIKENPHIREPVVQEQTQQIKEKPHITEPVVQEQTQQVKEKPHIREPVVQEQTHQIKENPHIREPVIQEQTKQTSKNKQQTHQDQEVPLWQESDIQEKFINQFTVKYMPNIQRFKTIEETVDNKLHTSNRMSIITI